MPIREAPAPDRTGASAASTSAIAIEGLTKRYRRGHRIVTAVEDLHLEVPTGGVFGFLGPNGSGKTTTIRAMTGLLRSFDGSVRVLDVPVPKGLDSISDRVGALVESPAFFPAFSGWRNLSLLAQARGIPDLRVESALHSVGLADRAGDPVKGYSLGMRQRLGVAAALLKDPDLMILDEPANGLDPDGMREMRRTLRALADQGRTVFVSSHLLAEVDLMCDRVAVLSRGRCVFSGPVAELTKASEGVRVDLHAGAPGRERAVGVLRAAGRDAVLNEDGVLTVRCGAGEGWEIVRLLARHDLWVEEITPIARSLEDGYVELIHGSDAREGGGTW